MRDTQKLPQPAQNRFTPGAMCSDTPSEHTGHLDKLFQGLSEGQTPNFLQMMAAISEISVEMTGDDGPCIDCMSAYT